MRGGRGLPWREAGRKRRIWDGKRKKRNVGEAVDMEEWS